MDTDIHSAWLNLDNLMEKRHGAGWGALRQGMQSSFYMGALAAITSNQKKHVLFSQAETGLQDAMGERSLRLFVKPDAPTP